MAVFDRVATGIKEALSKSNIGLYPTSPVVVQEAKTEIASEDENEKRDVF